MPAWNLKERKKQFLGEVLTKKGVKKMQKKAQKKNTCFERGRRGVQKGKCGENRATSENKPVAA